MEGDEVRAKQGRWWDEITQGAEEHNDENNHIPFVLSLPTAHTSWFSWARDLSFSLRSAFSLLAAATLRTASPNRRCCCCCCVGRGHKGKEETEGVWC